MAHLLHIDSSPRGEHSLSRLLAQEFVSTWQTQHPQATLQYRDVGRYPVPPVDEAWIAAAFTDLPHRTPEMTAALALSDQLVDEFLAATHYVMAIPMFNFSVPANFKAYIDQIVRVGRTFSLDPEGYGGMAVDKKLLVILTRGGSYPPGSPMGDYDLQVPFLRRIFNFIGVVDIMFVFAENLNAGEAERTASLSLAQEAIQNALLEWKEVAPQP